MQKKVLVTGSSGFIGSQLLDYKMNQYNLMPISLRKTKVEEVDFSDVDVILHLAGMAHQMTKIDDKIYFDVNKDLTLAFAKKAKKEGVKQFVFISTVKVYGDFSEKNTIYNEETKCNPTDPYGQSKFEAEQELMKLRDSNFAITIIRPPLVYGKLVKGNLLRLMDLAERVPVLPFGGIANKRSMVHVGNLTALIIHTIENKSEGIFIAGDKKAQSTTDLVQTIKKYLPQNPRIISLPGFAVSIIRSLKPELANRLFDSYILDNTTTNEKLGFTPPYSFDSGIKDMVESYLNSKN